MKRPAWLRWVRMLPKDELDAAHDKYGGLDKDESRDGGNGHIVLPITAPSCKGAPFLRMR